jgi:hypothetical protein
MLVVMYKDEFWFLSYEGKDHAAFAVVVGLEMRRTRRVLEEGRIELLLNGPVVRQRCHVVLLGLPDDVLARLSRFLAQLCAQLTLQIPDEYPLITHACAFSPCGRVLSSAGYFMGDKIQHRDVRSGKLQASSYGHADFRVNQVVIFPILLFTLIARLQSYLVVWFVLS